MERVLYFLIVSMIMVGSLASQVNGAPQYHDKHNSLDEVGRAKHTPVSVQRRSTIKVDYPVKKATRLFTAEGEKYWITGWNPLILKGDGFKKGDVFMVPASHNHNQSTFVVIEYSEEKGHIVYSRVVQGLSAGTIVVNVVPKGIGSSVEVIYTLTSLSKKGAEELSGLSDIAFVKRISHWESNIVAHKDPIDNWFKTGSK